MSQSIDSGKVLFCNSPLGLLSPRCFPSATSKPSFVIVTSAVPNASNPLSASLWGYALAVFAAFLLYFFVLFVIRLLKGYAPRDAVIYAFYGVHRAIILAMIHHTRATPNILNTGAQVVQPITPAPSVVIPIDAVSSPVFFTPPVSPIYDVVAGGSVNSSPALTVVVLNTRV